MSTTYNRAGSSNNSNVDVSGDMTVEQYLTMQCDEIISDLQKHCKQLVTKLNKEYIDGADAIQLLMADKVPSYKPRVGVSKSSIKDDDSNNKQQVHKKLCVTLKCRTGAHSGQKFRLEPQVVDGDNNDGAAASNNNVFKIGRSTGKLFKERGVSLYKDKEVSTTHAKIEIRNEQAFLIDTQSTNGTLLNGREVPAQMPQRILGIIHTNSQYILTSLITMQLTSLFNQPADGDVLSLGGTELEVHISDLDDAENFASV